MAHCGKVYLALLPRITSPECTLRTALLSRATESCGLDNARLSSGDASTFPLPKLAGLASCLRSDARAISNRAPIILPSSIAWASYTYSAGRYARSPKARARINYMRRWPLCGSRMGAKIRRPTCVALVALEEAVPLCDRHSFGSICAYCSLHTGVHARRWGRWKIRSRHHERRAGRIRGISSRV